MFLESGDLEWDDLLPFACYCYNIFPISNGIESPFFLMFGCNPAEGQVSHFNNCNRYYGNNRGKIILEKLHKLWKHHAEHLKDLCQWTENPTEHNHNNSTEFEIGQPVVVKNHACHTFKPKYLLDDKLKYLITAVLLITPNGKGKPILMMLNLEAQQNLSKMLGICF